MSRLAHLFFDLGDTIVDLGGLVPAMLRELRGKYLDLGQEARGVAKRWVLLTAVATPDAQGTAFRTTLELASSALSTALGEVGSRIKPGLARDLVRGAWKGYIKRAKFCADVNRRLLLSLRSRVVTLGLVTDGDEEAIRPLLTHLRLDDVFDAVVVSESVGAYKPSPQIYHTALMQCHATASASGFVSDSLVDLQGASAIGMGTIWIRRATVPVDVSPPGGAVVLPDFRYLIHLLDQSPKGLAHQAREQ